MTYTSKGAQIVKAAVDKAIENGGEVIVEQRAAHYHVGYNMVGYLPEMDVETFEDWESAKTSMIWHLESWADSADQGDNHDEAEELSSEAEDLNLDNGPEWGTIVGNESFWINVCMEDCDLDEE